jgi:hypothetical protein
MWINCVLTVYPGAIASFLLRAYVHLVVLSMPSINTSVRINNHPTYPLHDTSSLFLLHFLFGWTSQMLIVAAKRWAEDAITSC